MGLGAVGSATLHQLALRGVSAVGIDRFSPPHDHGSSHGETRITREGVGEGEVYSPLAIRSHEIWRALEAATGADLLLSCGMLAMAPAEGDAVFHGRDDFVETSAAAARRCGVAHERLGADNIRRRWPQFILEHEVKAYFEPGAGLAYPERCIGVQLAEAEKLGARVVRDEIVVSLDEERDGVRVVTASGVHHGDTAVVAAGAWLPALLAMPPGLLRLQPQALHWFAPEDPAAYAPDRFPTFIWSQGPGADDNVYGFPIPPGAATKAVKLGAETWETIAKPEERGACIVDAARVHEDRVAGRLAGLTSRVIRSAVCVYTTTPDHDFLVGAWPGRPRTLIASACSGHGFKHSAALGERLALAAMGDGAAIPQAFNPARFDFSGLEGETM